MIETKEFINKVEHIIEHKETVPFNSERGKVIQDLAIKYAKATTLQEGMIYHWHKPSTHYVELIGENIVHIYEHHDTN